MAKWLIDEIRQLEVRIASCNVEPKSLLEKRDQLYAKLSAMTLSPNVETKEIDGERLEELHEG